MNDLLLMKASKVKVFDGFNRANADVLGNADTGQTWGNFTENGVATGVFKIASNVAVPKTQIANLTTAKVLADTADVIMSMDFFYAGNSEIIGLMLRSNGDVFNRMFLDISGTQILLRKAISNAYTTLGTYPYAFPVGSITNIAFSAKGNVFKAYINDLLVLTVTDVNTLINNLNCGFFTYKTSTLCATTIDAFKMEVI